MEEAFSQVHHFALWPQEQKAAKSLVVYHSFYAADSELLDDKKQIYFRFNRPKYFFIHLKYSETYSNTF